MPAGQKIDGSPQRAGHGPQGGRSPWGTAYGLQSVNGGHYYTLLSDEWSALQQKYFMCGATITDIANPNNGNKKGLYGCMLLNVTNKAEATALLKQYGATVSSSLSDNLSFTGTNYQYFNYDYVKLTQAQFKELEKAGAVVFLPEAGHTTVHSHLIPFRRQLLDQGLQPRLPVVAHVRLRRAPRQRGEITASGTGSFQTGTFDSRISVRI